MTSIDELASFLEEADPGELYRFRFRDEDIYVLYDLGISHDPDEIIPRCVAAVFEVVVQKSGAEKHFRRGKLMEFSLSEVQRVETGGGALIYEAA